MKNKTYYNPKGETEKVIFRLNDTKLSKLIFNFTYKGKTHRATLTEGIFFELPLSPEILKLEAMGLLRQDAPLTQYTPQAGAFDLPRKQILFKF